MEAAREGARLRRTWPAVLALSAATAWMTLDARGFSALLRWLFPDEATVLYERVTMPRLMAQHVSLVGAASVIAFAIGAALGLAVLSRAGRPFKDVLVNLANFGQTVPSVALMALAVPFLGYGWEPVVLALVVFSVLPVMLNVVAGIESVPPDAVEAARGMGMSRAQVLLRVQLPLAAPVIVAGAKTMLVINVSAATLGALVGAGGLGVPIVAGLSQYNSALIMQGALPSALLALAIDSAL